MLDSPARSAMDAPGHRRQVSFGGNGWGAAGLDRKNLQRLESPDWCRVLRLAALAAVGMLPQLLKRPAYRLFFGYRVHPSARIGLSILDARDVELQEGAVIGSFNLVVRIERLVMRQRAQVGILNIIRGGDLVELGPYSTVMRLNVLNAIPEHDCTTQPESVLQLGAGAYVVSGHRIDFTDRVTVGRNVIIGGRNSSLWTHDRQETAPISVGDFCYLGSEVRLAPGARLPPECILGLGGVLTGTITEPRSLVGGVPARVVRALDAQDLERLRRRTRPDIPEDLYGAEGMNGPGTRVP
jgi:acetyltransferase-like isoleucine patch superfamily enzyme